MEKDIAYARRPLEGFEFAAWKFFKPSIPQPSATSGNHRFVPTRHRNSKIPWDSLENTSDTKEVAFLEILNDHFLSQLNFIPTRRDRVLDLVITNVPDRVRVLEVLRPKESDVFTDHGTVSFEFHASTKASLKIKRTVYDYRNGDFAGLREALEALNLCNLIQDSDDINLDWTYWKDAFISAVSDFIPTKKIKGKNTPPWITSEIIHAL